MADRTAGDGEPLEESGWRLDALAFFGWCVVAALLRFPGLARFSLWGDEIYTAEGALKLFTPAMEASDFAFPLFFLVERAVLELAGLAGSRPDPEQIAFAMRLVPALAGTLAVGAAFRSSRGFLRRRERHALAALIAFSPWFLFFAQSARYYALLLVLCLPATFELLRADRDGRPRRALLATVLVVVAVLVNPTAALLLVGHVAGRFVAAATRVRPLSRTLVPLLVVPALLALPAAIWPGAVRDTLLYKLRVEDAGVEGLAGLVLGMGWNIGPGVALLALLGLPVIWRRDRALAVQVVAGAGVPVLMMLGLAAAGVSVDQRYLIAIVPLLLVPAAACLGELAATLRATVATPAVPALALAAYLPGVASNFVDGDRHDLAAAAAVVSARLQPGDGVVAETHALMRAYLPADFPEERLIEAPPPFEATELERWGAIWKGCQRLWVIVQADFEAMKDPERSFHDWAWRHGHLVREVWPRRFDYHQNRLRVFLVDPRTAPRWWHRWRPSGG